MEVEVLWGFICKNVLGMQHKANTLLEPKEGTSQSSLTRSDSQATPLGKTRISLKYIFVCGKNCKPGKQKTADRIIESQARSMRQSTSDSGKPSDLLYHPVYDNRLESCM